MSRPRQENQALSALVFLHSEVLDYATRVVERLVRARRPQRLPVVLTRDEIQSLLSELRGAVWLMASLMYGSGLRLLECAELRIKDIDLAKGEIRIRDGKGRKDRVMMVPERVVEPLRAHLAKVKQLHGRDLARGDGWVALPDALDRKYPNAVRGTRVAVGAGREKPARTALIVVSGGPRRASAVPFWIAVPNAAAHTPVADVSLGRAPHDTDRVSTGVARNRGPRHSADHARIPAFKALTGGRSRS